MARDSGIPQGRSYDAGMKRLVVAGGIAVAIAVFVALRPFAAYEAPNAFVDRFLHAVVGAGASDRGWSQLDETTRQERFGSLAEAFREGAGAQDWSAFRWDVDATYELDSSTSWVGIKVEGGLGATPAFLRSRKLVGPWCLDDAAPGIGLLVWEDQVLGRRSLGPGGLTGTAERALAAGECVAAAVPDDQFQPGNDAVWAGHQVMVWNWTKRPLFLLDDDGHRVDLPACTKIALDDFAREFAVRAANGYVMSIGLDGPYDGVTTFVVIGSRDAYVNNAPPAEPMPPCEGEPQVQVGV